MCCLRLKLTRIIHRYAKYSHTCVIATWADVLNRANIGIEVMHERNAHNFPLDLASAEAVSAPVINS